MDNQIPLQNTPVQPQVTIVAEPNIQAPINNTQPQEQEKKPKMLRVISVLFFLLAFGIGLASYVAYGIIAGISNSNPVILSSFPTAGFIPPILSIFGLILFYAAIKINNGSKFSFWFGLFLLTLVFIPLGIILFILVLPLLNYGNPENQISLTNFSLNNLNFAILTPNSIPYLITLLLLIFSYSKFHFQNTGMSVKAKIFLCLMSLILLIPIFLGTISLYTKASDKGYGYAEAQSKVEYHIYKPSFLPEGLFPKQYFSNNEELAGKNNAVQVVYGPPLNKASQSENQPDPLIILGQVQVEPGFNLKSFIATRGATPTKAIKLPLSNQQNGLYQETTTKTNIYMQNLTFITNDNVLIWLIGMKISQTDFLKVAESLQ